MTEKSQKTVLLVDDEQAFIEALADALAHEGYRVLKARSADEAMGVLGREKIDLVTVDIMLPRGGSLSETRESHETGVMLCEEITGKYPGLDAFCISVVSDESIIKKITSMGVRFLRKGETPLRTVLNMIRSRLTGIAYSSERDGRARQE